MSWFQLDPSTLACRARSEGSDARVPSLLGSIARGIFGFTLVSIAGFAPWAIFGRWSAANLGEAGMYAACALIFIGLSGLLLHPLIMGPGSLVRFYQVFAPSFAAYAVAWVVGWLALGDPVGSALGLLVGSVAMGGMLAQAFDAGELRWKVVAALFVLNALGYFAGGWIASLVLALAGVPLAQHAQAMLAKLLWGVSYGIGFGAGLGLAFHLCQTDARAMLSAES